MLLFEGYRLLVKNMHINETKEGTILQVWVKPSSRTFKVVVNEDDVTVQCTEDPEKGKANRELINQLSKLFHKEVAIVSGASSKQKLVLIKGTSKSEVERLLVFSKVKSTF